MPPVSESALDLDRLSKLAMRIADAVNWFEAATNEPRPGVSVLPTADLEAALVDLRMASGSILLMLPRLPRASPSPPARPTFHVIEGGRHG